MSSTSSSPTPSSRQALIEALGSLSEDERQKLYGPNWAAFADRKVTSLEEARKWVFSLGGTMALFAIVVPTSAFYHFYEATESFSILGFLGSVAGACIFAAVQMGWAVYLYMSWRHQLQCYRALRALGHETEPSSEEAAASAS